MRTRELKIAISIESLSLPAEEPASDVPHPQERALGPVHAAGADVYKWHRGGQRKGIVSEDSLYLRALNISTLSDGVRIRAKTTN